MWRRTTRQSFPHSQPTFLHIIILSWQLANCVHASNWFTYLQPTWQIDGQNDDFVLTVIYINNKFQRLLTSSMTKYWGNKILEVLRKGSIESVWSQNSLQLLIRCKLQCRCQCRTYSRDSRTGWQCSEWVCVGWPEVHTYSGERQYIGWASHSGSLSSKTPPHPTNPSTIPLPQDPGIRSLLPTQLTLLPGLFHSHR